MMNYWGLYFKMAGLVALIMCISCSNTSRKSNPGDKTASSLKRKTARMCPGKLNEQIIDLSEHKSKHWYYVDTPNATRGVALVIHGLNLRPAKMESIIARLTAAGIETLNLSLKGHGENYAPDENSDPVKARLDSFKAASYQIWMQEICDAYYTAKYRSDQKKVPLFFVGFSLGGVMGTDLLLREPAVQFDKMVLFAPALKIHWRNYIVRVLSPFPGLSLPSFTAASYHSNKKTPMAGYNALFESINSVEAQMGPKANVPTLVFIDKKDEMVSYSRLKKMVAEQMLDQWQFFVVQKESSKGPAKIHHLIIDAPSTGENVWRDMMGAMVNHLYN